MIWLLEWSYPYNGDVAVSVFESEQDALKQACSEIVCHINNNLNLESCEEHISVSKEIQDLINKCDYLNAVKCWNFCDVNCDSDHSEYWSVFSRNIINSNDIDIIQVINFKRKDNE